MMTHDEMIEVIKAHKEGKESEYSKDGETWYSLECPPVWNFQYNYYRVKPTPKLRPWKPGEVPVGAVIRHLKSSTCWLIIGRDETSVAYSQGSVRSSGDLVQGCEWKWPQEPETAWKRCGVEDYYDR